MQEPDLNQSEFPKVSIVIAVYNAAEFVGNCIESLLTLNYPENKREIIAVDNYSADSSLKVLQKYEPAIRVLKERKRGAAAARNLGVCYSKYSIIAFTDADCIVEKNWLKHLIKPLQNQTEVIASGGRILTQKPSNTIAQFSDKIHDQRQSMREKLPYIITMNMAIRKNGLIDIGLFDTKMIRAQDTDLSYRLFIKKHKFSYAEHATIYHKNPDSLIALFRKGYQHGHWNVKLLKKHKNLVFSVQNRFDNYGNYRIKQTIINLISSIWSGKRCAMDELCQLTFDLGKKTGMLTGSIRFLFFYI